MSLRQQIEQRCPRAAAAGRISGLGRYALLTCEDPDAGCRKVVLFESPMQRNRAIARWEQPSSTCGVNNCKSDHVTLDFVDELVHA
jgi:hypothetical protein